MAHHYSDFVPDDAHVLELGNRPLELTFFALQNQENKTVAEVTSGKTVVEVMRGKKKHYR